jgi:hypothetical protein
VLQRQGLWPVPFCLVDRAERQLLLKLLAEGEHRWAVAAVLVVLPGAAGGDESDQRGAGPDLPGRPHRTLVSLKLVADV